MSKRISQTTRPGSPERSTAPAVRGNIEAWEADLRLVREILAGSAVAWELFIRRYSGLIAAVIRRYSRARDSDEVRTVYVRVLASLYEHKLAGYQGRAALSTWLTAVTRSEVLDDLRHQFGRREVPRGLRDLGEDDRVIYTLYYVRGWGLKEILDRLRQDDPQWSFTRLFNRLKTIENEVDDRVLRRIAYDLHAQSMGAASGRLLEYLDHVRLEYSQSEGAHRPEYYLMEREARRTVERVREIVSSMDAESRMLLELRFERGWSAERIADELGLRPRRRVYTLLERLLRTVKRLLKGGEGPRDG